MTFDVFISSFFLDWAIWRLQRGDVIAPDRVSVRTTRQLTQVTLSVNTEAGSAASAARAQQSP